MKPLVWITGAGGLIGNYLVQTAPQFAPSWRVRGMTRAQLDLLDFDAVLREFRAEKPKLVIHCAGLSRSPVCQTNPKLAHGINVDVTALLAELAANIPFVFFSSDLVFDGLAGNYDETALVNPPGVYAQTKVAAERIVLANPKYRGRLAPTPTGYLHLGHARTFWVAQQRARVNGGTLILRNEDLDSTRYKMEFVDAMIEDLKWFGFEWQEGPDCGGSFGPYNQSERMSFYRAALEKLRDRGFIYPCTCSHKDIQSAVRAPHAEDDDEPIYPGICRNRKSEIANRKFSWRFRVPDGETISFVDGGVGLQQFVAGKDFGDFIVWRRDDVPAYQLVCVVDDAAMQITEVVRGADLLKSTARQLLLYCALGVEPPKFFHCELITDEAGVRLAKRHDALSLRALRTKGIQPDQLRAGW